MQYNSCCGKIICCGCVHANAIARQSTEHICPFCRAPAATSVEKINKRIEVGDAMAIYTLGCRYQCGKGVPKDTDKALDLWHRAAKLGCVESHSNVGSVYFNGEGVEKDFKKAKYHWEMGAMGGHVTARHYLGRVEEKAGNVNRAMKHFMISAGFGCDNSLKHIRHGFSCGFVTKDEFEKALRAHKESKDEMHSYQRDAARPIQGKY
ncbi:hypothetical protein ACHAXR_002453 [Thalassiosira sp. AJA248-18]